jgi:K(+)-stimulated pyrophosphate-energized sodium pump
MINILATQISSGLLVTFTCIFTVFMAKKIWVSRFTKLEDNAELGHQKILQGTLSFLKTHYGFMVVALSFLAILLLFDSISAGIAFSAGALSCLVVGGGALLISVLGNKLLLLHAQKSRQSAYINAALLSSLGALWLVSVISLIGLIMSKFNLYQSQKLFFVLGTSIIALFNRIVGGVFTKSADMGADTFGKLQKDLNEDDPKNPATIADNVGDNVGDCLGAITDIYATATLIVTLALDQITLDTYHYAGFLGICSLAGFAIVAFINKIPPILIYSFHAVANSILSVIIFEKYLSIIGGIFASLYIIAITYYFTSPAYCRLKGVLNMSKVGAPYNILAGSNSGALCLILMGPALAIARFFLMEDAAFFYGVLSMLITVVAMDLLGPVTDNAGGLAEMGSMPQVRKTTDELDKLGNTTKAITKSYTAFMGIIMILTSDWLDISCHLYTIFFAIFYMMIISYTILNGVVNISTDAIEKFTEKSKAGNSLIEFLTYSSIRVLLKIIGFSMFVATIFVFLATTTQFLNFIPNFKVISSALGLWMTLTGGIWDNTKKMSEDINEKSSDTHKATVVGDVVGDPLKDTLGTTFNSLSNVFIIIMVLLKNPPARNENFGKYHNQIHRKVMISYKENETKGGK